MKQGCLAVCCSLLLALSANATFLQIERQVATPNLLIFDIFWQNPGSEGGLVDGTFLDADGRPLWQAGVKDQFPDSIRLLDVKVQMWGPGFQYSEDLWSFYVDEQRRFETLNSWQWDEQRQSGERAFDGDWWDTATFTLLDPYSARVTYAVPEPGVLAIGGVFVSLCFLRRKVLGPRPLK